MTVRTARRRSAAAAIVSFAVAILLAPGRALAGGGTLLGPTPYLSVADSPFAADIAAGTTYLETFECGSLTVPGVTASAGFVIPPGFEGAIDSVDADDGAIDGSGLAGHSFFSGSGSAGITFTFNQTTLGAFPTQVGIVWTDGSGTTTFEAFDSVGVSLGTVGPVSLADGSFGGGTAEDRFFGVEFAGGISAIRISNTSGGIEVDHLQYGLYASATVTPCGVGTPTPTVPAVATATPTPTITRTPTTAPASPTPTTTLGPIAPAAAVPTLSFPMLALLGLALAGAAVYLMRR